MVLQRFFVCVCGRVARAVADRLRAASPASTDDLTVEPRGELDRRDDDECDVRRTECLGGEDALLVLRPPPCIGTPHAIVIIRCGHKIYRKIDNYELLDNYFSSQLVC